MLRVALLLVPICAAACTSGVEDLASPDDTDGAGVTDDAGADGGGKADGGNGGLGAAWTSVGLGVAYQRVNAGNAVLIAYGGYSAKLGYSAAWSEELVDAKLGAESFGQIYAVQGPRDAGYGGREIANTKLRAHLATADDGVSPIIVVAHSSGSYVAHEMLGQLHRAGNTAVLARIRYFDLDGGGAGLSSAIADELGGLTFVSAHDASLRYGDSENASAAEALADAYAPKATHAVVEVSDTGCHSGAGWCLHDVLITHRPHNPDHYDLGRDYVDFVNRPVTDEYLP